MTSTQEGGRVDSVEPHLPQAFTTRFIMAAQRESQCGTTAAAKQGADRTVDSLIPGGFRGGLETEFNRTIRPGRRKATMREVRDRIGARLERKVALSDPAEHPREQPGEKPPPHPSATTP